MRKKRSIRVRARSVEGLQGVGFGGFRLDSTSARRAMASDPELQVVRARSVFGARHLASAVLHARRAHTEGSNRARDLRTEFLLYITGQRQVGDALKIAGLGSGSEEGAAVHFRGQAALERTAKAEGWERDDDLLEARPADLGPAGFSSEEIATALDPMLLPLERTALLTVQR